MGRTHSREKMRNIQGEGGCGGTPKINLAQLKILRGAAPVSCTHQN